MPSIGFNACQIHGDNYSGYNKFGVLAGMGVEARLSKKTNLNLGLFFSQKGSRHNPNPEKNDYSFYRVNLNYVEIPLQLKVQLNKLYFASIGGSYAYLINYQEDTEAGNWDNVFPFNKSEVAFNIGLGRPIKNNFVVEVRSGNSVVPIRNYGLRATGIFYPNPIARFFNAGLYNNILTLVVSYKINFKQKNAK